MFYGNFVGNKLILHFASGFLEWIGVREVLTILTPVVPMQKLSNVFDGKTNQQKNRQKQQPTSAWKTTGC